MPKMVSPCFNSTRARLPPAAAAEASPASEAAVAAAAAEDDAVGDVEVDVLVAAVGACRKSRSFVFERFRFLESFADISEFTSFESAISSSRGK